MMLYCIVCYIVCKEALQIVRGMSPIRPLYTISRIMNKYCDYVV